MKTLTKLCLLWAGTILLLIGCESGALLQEELPTLEETEETFVNSEKRTGLNARTTSLDLSGFQVTYDGQVFDGSETTFTYTVTGPAKDMHFRLELPGCAPANPTFIPSNGTTGDNDPFINPGVEWHPAVGSENTNSFTFEVIYPGFVKEGLVLVSVKSNSTTEVGEIVGACARVFNISGVVYTDANDNLFLDNDETGIDAVTVNLNDEFGALVATTVTDPDGGYLFDCIAQGSYSVMVDTNSVVNTSTTYLQPILPVELDVTIGPDATDTNFGFTPKTTEIIDALALEQLLTTGEDFKFWRNELKVAITGNGNSEIDKNTLIDYVADIRTLQLLEVYPLEGGDGLQAAYDILNLKPGNDDELKLTRELLTTEFNHVSGRGLTTDLDLQLVLIGWGESIVFDILNPESASGRQSSATSRTSGSSVEDALDLFGSINKSSGGGGAGN